MVKFIAAFGDRNVNVEISSPNGAGGSTMHLMFDRFYQGIIINRSGKWEVVFQVYNHDYTSAELDILIDYL